MGGVGGVFPFFECDEGGLGCGWVMMWMWMEWNVGGRGRGGMRRDDWLCWRYEYVYVYLDVYSTEDMYVCIIHWRLDIVKNCSFYKQEQEQDEDANAMLTLPYHPIPSHTPRVR